MLYPKYTYRDGVAMVTEGEYVEQILAIKPYVCQIGDELCPYQQMMRPIIVAALREHPYSGVFNAMSGAHGDGRACEGSEVHSYAVLWTEDSASFDTWAKRAQSWLRIFEDAGIWRAELVQTGYAVSAPEPAGLLDLLSRDYAAGKLPDSAPWVRVWARQQALEIPSALNGGIS